MKEEIIKKLEEMKKMSFEELNSMDEMEVSGYHDACDELLKFLGK